MNKIKVENEMHNFQNALNSFGLKGYKVYNEPGRKPRYFLRDNEGISITGYLDYTQLNHFILGYGKAFNKFKN